MSLIAINYKVSQRWDNDNKALRDYSTVDIIDTETLTISQLREKLLSTLVKNGLNVLNLEKVKEEVPNSDKRLFTVVRYGINTVTLCETNGNTVIKNDIDVERLIENNQILNYSKDSISLYAGAEYKNDGDVPAWDVEYSQYLIKMDKLGIDDHMKFERLDDGIALVKYFGFSNETKVVVPSFVTKIGYGAFQSNRTVKEIILPDGLKVISSRAFSCMESLKKLVIPSSVTDIGCNIVYSCASLETIEYYAEEGDIQLVWSSFMTRFRGRTLYTTQYVFDKIMQCKKKKSPALNTNIVVVNKEQYK